MPTDRDALFATTLAKAIRRQPLKLEQIAQHLADRGTPVSVATLSYWQRGRTLPSRESSMEAIAQLEEILRVPIGHLRGTVPSDAFSRWERVHALPAADRARGLLEAMDLDPLANFDTNYVHDHTHVGHDRHQRLDHTTELLTSTTDGLSATAMVLGLTDGETQHPLVEARLGCTLGRVVMLEEIGLMAVELLLTTPAARGESFVRGTTVQWWSDEDRAGDLPRVLGRSIPLVVLEATFDQPPARASYQTTPNQWDGANAENRLEQALVPAHQVQVCLSDPPAGWHRISWEFDDE